MVAQTQQAAMGLYQSNEGHWLLRPSNGGNKKGIIFLHGRSSPCWQPAQYPYLFQHLQAVCDAGYTVMSIDAGSSSGSATGFNNPYCNPSCMTAIGNARTYMTGTLGLNGSTKVGLIGWSLGSGQDFVYMQQNSGHLAGIVSYAGALDLAWFNTNSNLAAPYSYGAEFDRAYPVTTTTTNGSGTINQTGSTVTVVSTTGFPASGSFILYNLVGSSNGIALPTALVVNYTSKTSTTFLVCTCASGSQAWGTAPWTGVATSGGWATNAATHNPLQIAQTPLAWDNVPIFLYLAADDATVGRAQTPQASMCTAFQTAVNAASGHAGEATFTAVVGSQRAAGTTTIGASPPTPLTTSGQTVPVASTALFSAGGGTVIIENGLGDGGGGTPASYTGISGSSLTGVALFAGSQAIANGQVIYPALKDGHLNLHKQILASTIVNNVNAFSW